MQTTGSVGRGSTAHLNIHQRLDSTATAAKNAVVTINLPGCKVYTGTVSAQRLEATRTQYMTVFQQAVRSMARQLEGLPGERGLVLAMEGRARACMDTVLEGFDSLQLQQGFQGSSDCATPAFLLAVEQAHEAALQACGDLQKFVLSAKLQAGRSDTALLPVVREKEKVKLADGSELPGPPSFQVSRLMPQWETGVIRGGGAKGTAYGPVVAELAEAGMLDAIKSWVGTSAGALSALYLASGHTAAQFNAFTADMNASALLEEPAGFSGHYPSIKLGLVGHHGGEALRLADQQSWAGVSSYLTAHFSRGQDGNFTCSPEMDLALEQMGDDGTYLRGRLRDLMARPIDPSASQERSMVTFRDLKALHRLAPERFKNLVLTAYEPAKGKPFYFNAETTPNLPVAFAARASMSIPKYFKSVSLHLDPPNSPSRKFIDGGVGSNIPVEGALPMPPGRMMAEAHQRTLVLAFDDKGLARSAIEGDMKKMSQGLSGWHERVLSGNSQLDNARWADRVKLASAASGAAIVVKHGDIETRDVEASPHRVAVARGSARLHVLEQLADRAGGAIRSEVFTCPSHAFSLFSPAEKQALREASPEQLARQAAGGGAALGFLLELQRLAREEAAGDTGSEPSSPSASDVTIETKARSS